MLNKWKTSSYADKINYKMHKGKRKATKAPEDAEKTFEPFEENVCLW